MAVCPVCKTTGPKYGELCPNGCAYLVRDSALNVKAGGLERNLGKVIGGRYIVVGYLGRGGMGVVYRACDLKRDQELALKVLINPSPSARARRRFLREAKVAARLRHPNVVSTYGFGRVEGGFFLAMELIKGQPMSRFWRQGLPFDVLLDATIRVLNALHAAHSVDVIHRDLKPGNILVGHDQDSILVKVLDFGLARFVQADDLTRTGELVGTPRYMSPEQARGSRDIGPATDLYALGVILYEFITGKLLFDAETPTAVALMHITEPVPKLVPRRGLDVPTGFEAILQKLLAKAPESRFSSAAAVKAALSPFRSTTSHANTTSILALSRVTLNEEDVVNTPDSEEHSLIEELESGICFKPGFVGRKQPLRELWQALHQTLHAGRGCVFSVYGETGIGKSALVDIFRRRVQRTTRMRWILSASQPDTGQGLDAIRHIFDEIFDLKTQLRPAAAKIIRERFEQWGAVSARAEDVRRILDLLRPESTVDPTVQTGLEATEQDANPQVEREQIFSILERVLRRVAATRAIVIVLEDLHYAGSMTRRFLEYLAANLNTTPAPIFFCTTFRSDDPASETLLQSISRNQRTCPETFRSVQLGPLHEDDALDLLYEMVPATDELNDHILRHTAGNPLHIIQTLRYLKDEGHIVLKGDTWDLSDSQTVSVPPLLHDLIMARLQTIIAQHPPEANLMEVLRRAALIGQRVPYMLVRRVFDLEREWSSSTLIRNLDNALEIFTSEGILTQDADARDDILRFEHNLLRETLATSFHAQPEARQTHLAAAQAKEEYYTSTLDARAAEIAAHYEATQDWYQTIVWLLRAAQVSRTAWELSSCKERYEHARDLTQRLGHTPPSLHFQIFTALGELSSIQGRHREAFELFGNALHMAETMGDPSAMASALFMRGEVARTLERFQVSESAYRECLAVSRAVGLQSQIAKALLGLARLFQISKHLPESHQFLNAAEEQFQTQNDRTGLAEVAHQRAYVFMRSGDFQQARIHLKAALSLFTELNDKHSLACVHRDMAQLALYEGRLRNAQIQARKAMDSFESIGARYGFAKTLSVLSEIYCAQQHYKAAEDLSLKAQTTFDTLSSYEDSTREAFSMGVILLKSKQIPTAQAWFSRTQDQASRRNFVFLEGLGLAGLAWIACHQGEAMQVRSYLHRAFPLLDRETSFVPVLGEILTECAKLLINHGDLQVAEACQVRADAIMSIQQRNARSKTKKT